MADPTVVLLSVGEESGVLIEEIEKKGLRVVSCAFSEAEEAIEANDPLLVVLHGARGAAELSTLLEDDPGGKPQKAAIVAPRKDLAQLMGLNREIVIGLIAVEMTEKTAAARVEALARQTAKQRGVSINLAARRMSLGPRPSIARLANSSAPKENVVLDAPTPQVGGVPDRGGKDEDAESTPAEQRPARAEATPAQESKEDHQSAGRKLPTAPRVPGGTAIGLPEPRRRDSSAGGKPRHPEESAPKESEAEREGKPSRPEESAPKESRNERNKRAAESLSPSLLESVPPVPSPPSQQSVGQGGDAQVPQRAEEQVPKQPESLSPSMLESVPAGEGPESPEMPPNAAVPQFDPSELLKESALTEAADLPLEKEPAEREFAGRASGTESVEEAAEAGGIPVAEQAKPDDRSAEAEMRFGETTGEQTAAPRGEGDNIRPVGGSWGDDEAGPARNSADEENEEDLAFPLVRHSQDPVEAEGSSQEARPIHASASDEVTEESSRMAASATGAQSLDETVVMGGTSPVAAGAPDKDVGAFPEMGEPIGGGAAQDDWDEPPPLPTEALHEGTKAVPQEAEARPRSSTTPPATPRSRGSQGPGAPALRSRGKLKLAATAVLLLAAGGVTAYVWETQNDGASRRDAALIREKTQLEPPPQPSSPDEPTTFTQQPSDSTDQEKKSPKSGKASGQAHKLADSESAQRAAEGKIQQEKEEEGAQEVPAGERSSPASQPQEQARARVDQGSDTPASGSVTEVLDNPFRTPDENLPGCDELAPNITAQTVNPVAEASQHWSTARKLIVKGDIEGASRAMCKAVVINPESPAVEGLARLYMLARSPRRAMKWVKKSLARTPEDRDLIALRGDIKSQLGRQEAAVEDWLTALSLDPEETQRREGQAKQYAQTARRHRSRGDLARAEQYYRRALGFDPENLSALAGMAQVMLERELYDHAGTFAIRALDIFEALPETHVVLGDIARAKNQPEAARSSYERALAIRPDFWPAKTRLRELSN